MNWRICAAGGVGLDAFVARLRAIAPNLASPALLTRKRRSAAFLLNRVCWGRNLWDIVKRPGIHGLDLGGADSVISLV